MSHYDDLGDVRNYDDNDYNCDRDYVDNNVFFRQYRSVRFETLKTGAREDLETLTCNWRFRANTTLPSSVAGRYLVSFGGTQLSFCLRWTGILRNPQESSSPRRTSTEDHFILIPRQRRDHRKVGKVQSRPCRYFETAATVCLGMYCKRLDPDR